MKSPKNAERLLQAIEEDQQNTGTVRELLD
ncbi:MAG: hypothetical protein ACJAWO_000433 [Halieaceae bacterium]|jgi:hypothetical protein